MTVSSKLVYTGVAGRSEKFLPGNIAVDIVGGDFDDWIDGSSFSNIIEAGSDEDYVNGNFGEDIIYGDNRSDGPEGSRVGSLTDESDVLLGGLGNDVIFGQSGFDYISGGLGNDAIFGGLGDDFLQGHDGTDFIYGGAGSDIIWGGFTSNVPVGYAKTINYTYDGINDAVSPGTINSSFGSSGSATEPSADHLDGGDGNDFIYGQGGNDALFGAAGDDQIYGGTGTDFVDGSVGFDFARYDFASEAISVRLDTGVGYGGEADGDYLTGVEGLVGSFFGDALAGNAAANTIFGQGGNDAIYGFEGADSLNGGGGSDTFGFRLGDFQAGVYDRITDFHEVVGDTDLIALLGVPAASLRYYDTPNGALITTVELNGSGGIIVDGVSLASIGDQIYLV